MGLSISTVHTIGARSITMEQIYPGKGAWPVVRELTILAATHMWGGSETITIV